MSNEQGSILDNWCFQYKYDSRQRMTHKKLPGVDWVYMVYDDRDRIGDDAGRQSTIGQSMDIYKV
ncbi:MAG: hypothetical protein WDO14_00315 [Bacteroidota bacterium]